MQDRTPLRSIAQHDLSRFPRPDIRGNRSLPWRAAWYVVNALFFQSAVLALLPGPAKTVILRAFGAKVGRGLVCKPRVTIKYPWFLELGDHVWIGECVWIDNLCAVTIGSNVCLSQGVRLLTGSHDWASGEFTFFARPITIAEGVWITAFRVLRPGVKIPAHVAVTDDVTAADIRTLVAASEAAKGA